MLAQENDPGLQAFSPNTRSQFGKADLGERVGGEERRSRGESMFNLSLARGLSRKCSRWPAGESRSWTASCPEEVWAAASGDRRTRR